MSAALHSTVDRPEAIGPITLHPGTEADGATRDRMAALLFETSYLEFCSASNTLGLPLRALQRRQNIEPYLAHIRVLRMDGRFAGFCSAATLAEFARAAGPCWYREDMRTLDAAYEAFVDAHTAPTDTFLASIALEPAWRGRGLFRALFDDVVAGARRAGSPRVVLAVWDSNPAQAMYRRLGFVEQACFDQAWCYFHDRLRLIALPLAPTEREPA